MSENYGLVSKGFILMTQALAPFIAQQLNIAFKEKWWNEGVINTLNKEQIRGLPTNGEYSKLVDSLDIMRCLQLLDYHWVRIFKFKLNQYHLNWIKELKGIRNLWAHSGSVDWSVDDTWRALDTMYRLTENIDAEIATGLKELKNGSFELSFQNRQTKKSEINNRVIFDDVKLNNSKEQKSSKRSFHRSKISDKDLRKEHSVAYYLSRFEHDILYPDFSQSQAIEHISKVLGVKSSTLRQKRDAFDPYVNELKTRGIKRRGYWQKTLSFDMKEVFDHYLYMPEEDIEKEIRTILKLAY